MTHPGRPPEVDGSHEPECLRAALAYAVHGWAVFPVHPLVEGRCSCGRRNCSSPGKHPLTRHGLNHATSDPAVVHTWWRRWPRANLAIATGSTSGLVVIDVDPPPGVTSLERLFELGYSLPETLTARTGSGGLHLYYAAPATLLGNAAGRLPGVELELAGVDLRAEGGYVVAPPSLHVSGRRYRWIEHDVMLAAAPEWLKAAEPSGSSPAFSPEVVAGTSSAYGLAALEAELRQLGGAPVGTRNHTLNRAVFCLGQLVAGGELDEGEVVSALRTTALARGLGRTEVERTIASGLDAGRRQPRSSPPC